MDLRLDGKVALITGGSRGIGLGIARCFADAGASVMLTSRTASDLERAVLSIRERGGAAAWCAADVADRLSASRCVGQTVDEYGGIDILVNNAGINPYAGPVLGIDDERADRATAVNLNSVIVWTGEAWRASMQSRGGSVLNIAAVSGLAVYRGAGWYGALKAAMIHLTRQLAYEMAPAVRVNTIAPGIIKTTMGPANAEEFGLNVTPRPVEDVISGIPLGRLGEAEDVAAAALYLSSDAASWVTGNTLAVDGGMLTLPGGTV